MSYGINRRRGEKIPGLRSKVQPNEHALTIVDEAHSLINPYDEKKQQAVSYGSKGNWFEKIGPQAYYIIYTSRISVFFMEDAQGFQDRETTTVEDIEALAGELGAEVKGFELTEQFRCGHSAEYVEWIDRLFSDSSIANHSSWKDKFNFAVFDYPERMEESLRDAMARADRPSGRLLSSYSVPWPTKGMIAKHSLCPDQMDFQLKKMDGSSWSRCWNTPGEFVEPVINSSMIDDPLCEVGYPQEIRGWDFSFFGILWLDDVVWRNDRWQIRWSAVGFDRGIASQRTQVVKKFKSWGYDERLMWCQEQCDSLPDARKCEAEKLHDLIGKSGFSVETLNERKNLFGTLGYSEKYVWNQEEFKKLTDGAKIERAREKHERLGDTVDADRSSGEKLHNNCYDKKWCWDQAEYDRLSDEQKVVADGLHKCFGDRFEDADAREKLASLGYGEQMMWSSRSFNSKCRDLTDAGKDEIWKMHELFGDSAEYIWYTNGSIPEIDKLCVTMFRIYRILLTRAIEGNFVYIKDRETRARIESLLQ